MDIDVVRFPLRRLFDDERKGIQLQHIQLYKVDFQEEVVSQLTNKTIQNRTDGVNNYIFYHLYIIQTLKKHVTKQPKTTRIMKSINIETLCKKISKAKLNKCICLYTYIP